jgi:hypothetical protein
VIAHDCGVRTYRYVTQDRRGRPIPLDGLRGNLPGIGRLSNENDQIRFSSWRG